MARDESISLKVSAEGLAALDRARGQWSRSEYTRQALARAINGVPPGEPAKLRGPVTGEVNF